MSNHSILFLILRISNHIEISNDSCCRDQAQSQISFKNPIIINSQFSFAPIAFSMIGYQI